MHERRREKKSFLVDFSLGADCSVLVEISECLEEIISACRIMVYRQSIDWCG
ncbi:MAG: hypothetical protein Q7J09_07260 [Methanocalculus sp.]|uniref:hypothetical protein n=1 Tax=Methanocalculus sp. TaxID=2004547 RepID=UPI002722DA0C|nr:hypothetical protein [Methanocalculus sp.]MDO8842423.1 hypothetical protein [Methanocalculus sp.]MDO9539782.1 hypothetical protein [Methanocalculus sp.]